MNPTYAFADDSSYAPNVGGAGDTTNNCGTSIPSGFSSDSLRDFYLDWAPVKLHYGP